MGTPSSGPVRTVSRAIRVRGCVQGVGYRPFVWQRATALGLDGHVANDAQGVTIIAQGDEDAVDRFAAMLRHDAPPLARVTDVEQSPGASLPVGSGFVIAPSMIGAARTGIAPDAATCPACLAEVRNPAERRHGYALTNCTHCGPRLSIITAVPYDRPNTTMADFPMCARCAAEYADPADRRFHAQPIACPDCGPRLTLVGPGVDGDQDPLMQAASLLREGRIIAVKGLGGYHLACLAMDDRAVATLRRRKARDAKPFAVMMPSLAAAQALCAVNEDAGALLAGPAAPIVLLPVRDGVDMPDGLAPGLDTLGVMLPYTPLHHLLMDHIGAPLVMTSANHSGEPQVIDDEEARVRLADLADAWLFHDRRIINRIDDSVVAVSTGGPMVLRRARGMAPAPISLPDDLHCARPVLAMGGDLKATFCLLRDGEAVVSQHFGDLSDATAHGDYQAMIDLYCRLYDFAPALVVVDTHDGYQSARLGRTLAAQWDVPVMAVGHHHAHMASCLVENGLAATVDAMAIVCDGLGMGDGGALWGGELLVGGYLAASRAGALPAVALPGGNAAMRQPWRNLVAHLGAALGPDWRDLAPGLTAHLPPSDHVAVVEQAIAHGINAPPCSSAGRWFDAVAAAVGIHADAISHEGQAAMRLEAMARRHMTHARSYPVGASSMGADGVRRIALAPFWRALASDVANGRAAGEIAADFHATFAAAMTGLVGAVLPDAGMLVALTGGVMQNVILRDALADALTALGCRPIVQRLAPAGDGGLSLGQAAIAAARINGGVIEC